MPERGEVGEAQVLVGVVAGSDDVRRDAALVDLVRDVAERGVGVEGDRLVRVDVQAGHQRRELLLLSPARSDSRQVAAGALVNGSQSDTVCRSENESTSREAPFVPLSLADDALGQRVLDRVAHDRQERRVDRVEADDLVLVVDVVV